MGMAGGGCSHILVHIDIANIDARCCCWQQKRLLEKEEQKMDRTGQQSNRAQRETSQPSSSTTRTPRNILVASTVVGRPQPRRTQNEIIRDQSNGIEMGHPIVAGVPSRSRRRKIEAEESDPRSMADLLIPWDGTIAFGLDPFAEWTRRPVRYRKARPNGPGSCFEANWKAAIFAITQGSLSDHSLRTFHSMLKEDPMLLSFLFEHLPVQRTPKNEAFEDLKVIAVTTAFCDPRPSAPLIHPVFRALRPHCRQDYVDELECMVRQKGLIPLPRLPRRSLPPPPQQRALSGSTSSESSTARTPPRQDVQQIHRI